MFHATRVLFSSAAALAAAGVLATPAISADFYKGKTLNVIINYGAGGNTDVQGRTLMRYMAKYIPGQPRVVIRNMPGAGGGVAANYMNKGAKRDGSVMGVFTTPWMHELANSGVLTASLKDLTFLGAIGQQQIAHVRKDVGGGTINNAAEFIKISKSFKTAGHSPSTSKDISINITLRMLGIKHEHVTGFKSAGPIRRAIIQNEVQYSEDSLAGYYGGVTKLLIKPGISVPLWHNGIVNKEGLQSRAESAKDLPTFSEVYQMKFGKDKKPSGLDWDLYVKITNARQFLRTIVMPPGAPAPAADAIRSAWLKVVKDKEYLAAYAKKNRSQLNWKTGADAKKNIVATLSVKPELAAHVAKITGLKKK